MPLGLYQRLPRPLLAPVSLEGHGGSTYTGLAALTLLGMRARALRRGGKRRTQRRTPQQREQADEQPRPRAASAGRSTVSLPRGLLPAAAARAALRWASLRQGDGFSGRVGKAPDSCYAFWVGASLHLLAGTDAAGRPRLRTQRTAGNRAFVVRACEGARAGFGRDAESGAEVYHSHYAVAGLALMQAEDGRDANNECAHGCDDEPCARCESGCEQDDDGDGDEEDEDEHRAAHWRLAPIDPVLGISRRAAGTEGVAYPGLLPRGDIELQFE